MMPDKIDINKTKIEAQRARINYLENLLSQIWITWERKQEREGLTDLMKHIAATVDIEENMVEDDTELWLNGMLSDYEVSALIDTASEQVDTMNALEELINQADDFNRAPEGAEPSSFMNEFVKTTRFPSEYFISTSPGMNLFAPYEGVYKSLLLQDAFRGKMTVTANSIISFYDTMPEDDEFEADPLSHLYDGLAN